MAAGHHFEVKSSHLLEAAKEKGISIAAVAREKPDTGPLESRPSVTWDENPMP